MKKQIKNFILTYALGIPLIFYGALFGIYYGYIYWHDKVYQEGYSTGFEVGNFEGLNQVDFDTTSDHEADILHKLSLLESSGGKFRKILDTNNKYSMGLYHFQAGTVQDMYKRYYGKKISIEEAVRIANDDTLATQLAKCAIFQKSEKYHWKNSFIKLNNLGIK